MSNITVILTLTGLLFSSGLYSQTDTSFVVGDTIIEKSYYKNGQLAHLAKFVKGRDIHSFHFSFWYYDNGNPKWLTYWDTFIDSSYYISGRKNGSIKRKDIYSKHNWETIEQNKRSEIIKRSYSQRKDTFYFDETYKHGQLVSTIKKPYKKTLSSIDTVKYYQGQVGGNSMVLEIENNGIKEYTVNGTKMNEAEYNTYKKKYDNYIQSRKPKHFYKEYTADSILIYEGTFKGVDLPCGTYKEYYPNGVVKERGDYNNKGEKNNWWTYYNEQGLFYKTELYENGKLKQ